MGLLNTKTYISMGDTTTKVQFNTPSTGMMQRSHPKSKFIRFQKGSQIEKEIFPLDGSTPTITLEYYSERNFEYAVGWTGGEKIKKQIPIEVLQILVFGDNYYLVEYVKSSDLVDKI